MAFDEGLAARVREALRDQDGLVEKVMFGGPAFLAHGHLIAGVHGDDLIARVDADDDGAALARSGARPFDITGRPMRGWVLVAGEHLDDDQLASWLRESVDVVAELPPA